MTLPTVFVAGFLTTLGGVFAVAIWRGGGRLTAALVEIARLPTVVDTLVEQLNSLTTLVGRVDKIEASLSVTTEGAHHP